MRRRALVINLGWEQEPLLDRLNEAGLDLYGVHYDKNYYKLPVYKDLLITDLRDLDKIQAFADQVRPDAVISDQCDYSYFAQSVVAEKLGLPGPRIQEAQVATNKYLQRMKARELGLGVPEFQLCLCAEDVSRFAEKSGFPLITKPVDNRGSFGVNRIDVPADIPHAFRDALVNSHSRLVIAEQFIEGLHITVDGYVFQGVGPRALALATKQKLQDKKAIIDGEIIYPGRLSDDLYEAAIRNAEAVAAGLGFRFGFFHGEFMIDRSNRIFLTEIANRGGGVYTSEVIVPYCSGVDVLDTYIRDVLGATGSRQQIVVDKKPVMMKFFSFSHLSGRTVRSIQGLRDIKQDGNVLKIRVLLQRGSRVPKIQSGAHRHGVIIVSAKTVEQLNQNFQTALSKLHVDYE